MTEEEVHDCAPSLWEMLQNAERIVAEDEARERARTIPQEPWPVDGSLPLAEHVQVWHDEVKWTGHAYGIQVTRIAPVEVSLYVKPTVERHGKDWVGRVRLVTAEGKTWAESFVAGWWWA